jgi:tRNA-dihydrouridine synthase 1
MVEFGKLVVAPMVDQSELAWRILSRRYKAQLCYTPMFNAKQFLEPKYRKKHFTTNQLDRPLIVQFCANDPKILLQAARFVEHSCDAVDINLGCPQNIAKKGHYGAFLQDEWDLICSMVEILHKHLTVPVTCKIRIFPQVEKTIEYAKRIEAAGCAMLVVHGRTREQRAQATGLADWEQIRLVKYLSISHRNSLKIPVYANGNILYDIDIDRCISATGVNGVMTAEGSLYNPAIFCEGHYSAINLSQEYLNICKSEENSSTPGSAKAHLFKMMHKLLELHHDLREQLALIKSFEDLQDIVTEMKLRTTDDIGWINDFEVQNGLRVLPDWALQPKIRPPIE